MTTRELFGPKVRSGGDVAEDDLTRLVRMIARQAAQEAFAIFRDALESSAQCGRQLDLPTPLEAAEHPSEPGERFLSIAEVAKRLGVSEKTARRKIESGELPAIRVGRLLRVSERSLSGYLSRALPGRG